MPRFLSLSDGSPGICDRCARKFPLSQLKPDPNAPGLMVCDADRDQLDPYRLPPRGADRIALPLVRPDVLIAADDDDG
jgi:hypothetical protein